jgi:CheY-like chemotaxis protein
VSSHEGQKVALVVDDEVFARLFAIQILLDEGFTVLEAADAAEGLEMLDRNDDVSLLFTDINMPGDMDGIELAAKAREAWPDVALLLTSGRVEPSGGEVPPGGRFLPKPYTAHALMSMIRELERTDRSSGRKRSD